MTELVVFGDIEQLLVDYLTEQLDQLDVGIPVSTRVPLLSNGTRPPEFVRLMVTGGAQRDIVVDSPLVTVEAWAERESRAVAIASLCRAIIHGIDEIQGVQFHRIESASRPQNLPDPTTDQIRYTATYSIDYRGAPL